ncbi:MarR family transcriptional regulator [Paenibacillus sp. HB172176]|uniref:MarR family winged helix-turn-helix transcriptional regulator n=1 Tax=Paenibacillus sp. HB172176 TaxID=2493690 RepID=UPI00143A17C6|nr:MarR family transcriptional regulator [Paenibacillus sp. HB172176]
MNVELLKDLIQRYKSATFIIERRFISIFREHMSGEITVDQYKTLSYLRKHGPCTSTELADMFCVGKSSITAIINRLSDKQFIERIPETKDRRVIQISLTDEGAAVCEEMDEKLGEILGGYMNQFEEQEALAFIETFERLASEMQKA